MTDVRKLSRQDYLFLFYLLVLVSSFAVHFLSFTLFDGFATFSNDAGSYVVLARKWSPFFPPSDAELYTWPIQILPPGFTWALAITGASESLWAGHLLVSLCMLASIFLVGWMAYRQLGWLIGGLLAMGLCLLPGVVISSMGILSENLYLLLSLGVLLVHSFIKKNDNISWGWYLLLFFFLTLAVLTRTVGITLIAAILLVTLFDKGLARKQKNVFYLIAFSSAMLWQLWGVSTPQTSDLTYGFYLNHYFGTESHLNSTLSFLWNTFSINTIQILSSWNHYLSLSYSNIWFFIFSYSLFILCIIGLGLRLLQRRLDAVYIMFYIAILLIWPHLDKMTRLLHPIVFLLVLQPVFYWTGGQKTHDQLKVKTALVVIALAFIFNSAFIQLRLLERQDIALNTNPTISYSYEFYDSTSIKTGLVWGSTFSDIMKHMVMSAQHVPIHGVVATVKPTNYSILADRRAINLVAVVPYLQQLCNLKIIDVDVIFLSPLTTGFNQEELTQLEKFKSISSVAWMTDGENGGTAAYNLAIDKAKLNSELIGEGYDCQSFQDRL